LSGAAPLAAPLFELSDQSVLQASARGIIFLVLIDHQAVNRFPENQFLRDGPNQAALLHKMPDQMIPTQSEREGWR
jgi:hypothetical protein